MARRKSMVILPTTKVTNKGVWYVQYSVRNPQNGKMIRFRIYEGFDACSDDQARLIHAQKIIDEYTFNLKNGWTPYQDEKIIYEDQLMYSNLAGVTTRLRHCSPNANSYMSEFLCMKQPEIAKKTYDTYKSKFRLFNQYLASIGKENIQVQLINNDLIVSFLKHIAEKKGLSKVTMEKYQQILFTFFEYLKNTKKVIGENPATHIPRVGVIKDQAPTALPERYRRRLQQDIEREDPQLWLCCLFQYYAAVRPGNELRLLKVQDINFEARSITIKNYHAKNNRTETIQMPDALYDWLLKYDIDLAPADHYVFGKKGVPGVQELSKNSLRLRFNKFRDRLHLPKEVKLYSWKHSGAQELNNAGVNMYEISRHLRHKNLQATEHYIRKRLGPRNSAIKHNFPDI